MQIPPLDGLDLLTELAPRSAPALLRRVCDLEFLEPVPECGVELASRLVRAGHRLPAPFPEGFLVSGEILGRDDGPHRAEPVGQLAGLADLPAEQFRIHRAAVDVLQRDPAPRQEPVQFDDPAHEIRIGLLPERFSALAEELVDEGGDAVGERVGVEQRIVERVPLQRAVEPDLEVVAAAPGVVEDAAHAVAEVALDLEHKGTGPAPGPVGLPREELLGERVHAGGGLAGADGADDEHAGVEPRLGNDEPGGPLALARNDGMVELADHERGRVVLGRGGPGGEPAPAAAPCGRLKPHPPDREAHAPGKDDDDGRDRVVPDADHGVKARIVVGDEVQNRVAAHAGERRPESVAGGRSQSGADDGERSRPHRSNTLPGRIDGSGATPGGRGQVRKHTCPRTRTRPLDWGVAPVPVSAARAALTDPAAKAQDVAVSWLTP